MRLCRIFPTLAMHFEKTFCLGIVRFEIVVADRPSRRQSTIMMQQAEVFSAETKQRSAVELRVPAHIVVRVRMKRLSLRVVPVLLRLVLSFEVHQRWIPVGFLARNKVTTFKNKDSFSRGRKPVGESAPSSSASDDDDVVVVNATHGYFLSFRKICSSPLGS